MVINCHLFVFPFKFPPVIIPVFNNCVRVSCRSKAVPATWNNVPLVRIGPIKAEYWVSIFLTPYYFDFFAIIFIYSCNLSNKIYVDGSTYLCIFISRGSGNIFEKNRFFYQGNNQHYFAAVESLEGSIAIRGLGEVRLFGENNNKRSLVFGRRSRVALPSGG